MGVTTFLQNFRGEHYDSTTDVDNLLRNQLFWLLSLRVILYTLLLAINYVFQDSRFDITIVPSNLLFLFLAAVYISAIVSVVYLRKVNNNLRKFGFIQTLLDVCFVSLIVFFSGTSKSNFATAYFFPIIAGGLLLPRKGGMVAAAAASLQYGGLLILESYNFYPPYLKSYQFFTPGNIMVNINQFAVHGIIFFLAALLSALFGLRLKRTETALTDSLEKFDQLSLLYKQIFDNITTGIITIDNNNKITSANNAIEEITGHQTKNLIGKNLEKTIPNLTLKDENHRQTTDFYRNDGKKLRLGYSHMLIKQGVNNGPDLGSHKIITLRDITELEQLERQVRQSEKLAAIGMMSASIAHDFRNPLTAISGSAQVLSNEFAAGEKSDSINYELATIILRESNRLINTIGEFLKFSRPESVKPDWFSLQSCFDEVLQVLRAGNEFPATTIVDLQFDPAIDVWGDEKQMFTVFSHLLQNSISFCPAGKEKLRITAEEISAADGEELVITISDNGTGITETEPEQIFEPFYTNRADGTGLGLAIVKQIVTEHQGSIAVANKGLHNNSGQKGAQFTITMKVPRQ